MAKDQLPTIDISQAELSPRNFAQVTDSYVRPETPAPSNLWEVAQSLGNLDGDLKAWAGKKQAQQTQDDAIRGQAQFLKDNRVGYAEGVKRGLIPAWASPSFQEGYKRAEGDYIGQNFGRDLDLAYAQWAGKDTATPAQFDEWAQSFTRQALKTNDPAVLRGMLPLLNQQLEAKRVQHTDFIAKKSYETGLTSHIAAATAAIETFEEDGLKSPTGTNYEGIWTDIMARRKAASEAGVRGDDFDKEMVDSILSTAIKNHDGNLLDLFNKNLPGSETAIKDDPRFRDKLAGSEDKLLQIAAQQQEAAYKAQERADKDARERITGATITEIAKNPTAPIPEEILAAGTKLDPEFRTKMLQAQKSLAEGGPEDQDQIMRLQQKLLDGGGQADVLDALHSGIIRKTETFTKLLEFSKGHEAPILQHDTAKQIMQMIKTRTDSSNDVADIFGIRGLTDAGMAATLDFQKSALDWAQRNPNASYVEQMKALSDMGKHILDNVHSDAGEMSKTSTSVTYTPEAAQQDQPNAFVKKTAAPDFASVQKMVEAANANRNPQQERVDSQLNDVRPPVPAPSLDRLSPAARKNLETEAKKYGLDPAIVWERTWLKLDQTKRDLFNNATQPPLSAPQPQGDASTILETIRKAEAPAGYDSVYTGSKVQPPKPLSQMTLGEVLNFQSHMKQSGSASTAIGGYQFLQDTLQKVSEQMGLSPATPFTPELQDQIAVYLLGEAGWKDFKSGKLDANAFADKLAGIWAGLPDASGKSKYEGDGLNSATISRDEVIRSLVQKSSYAPQGGGEGGNDLPILTGTQGNRQPLQMKGIQPAVLSTWQKTQNAFGKQVAIVSGFRDPETNAKAGGAKGSEHMHGSAIDLDVSGLSHEERVKLIDTASQQGFRGIGVYANSIHLDLGSRRAWGPSHGKGDIPQWAKAVIKKHMGQQDA